MGVWSGPKTLEELVRAKLPVGTTVSRQRLEQTMETEYVFRHNGIDAKLQIGDEVFIKLDYPALMAEAIIEEVLRVFDCQTTET